MNDAELQPFRRRPQPPHAPRVSHLGSRRGARALRVLRVAIPSEHTLTSSIAPVLCLGLGPMTDVAIAPFLGAAEAELWGTALATWGSPAAMSLT